MHGATRATHLPRVEPGLLEGALARLLRDDSHDEVVQVSRRGVAPQAGYDAAVVPEGVRADVVITLPDTRGSGGTGTVRSGQRVSEVSISSPEQVVELLESYVPRPA